MSCTSHPNFSPHNLNNLTYTTRALRRVIPPYLTALEFPTLHNHVRDTSRLFHVCDFNEEDSGMDLLRYFEDSGVEEIAYSVVCCWGGRGWIG